MKGKHSKKVKIRWGRFLLCLACVALVITGVIFGGKLLAKLSGPADPSGTQTSAKTDKQVRASLHKPWQSENEDVGPAPELQELTIRCVGDIMGHMGQIRGAWNGSKYDFTYSYKYVKQFLSEGDLTMGNLESSFTGDGKPSGYPRFDSPDAMITDMVPVGFNFALFANNHMIDQGVSAARRTVSVLKKAGFLGYAGARENTSEPRSAIVEVKGVKIGVLAYTYESTGADGVRKINGIPMTSTGPDYINSFRYGDGSIKKEDKAAIKSEIQWCRDNGAEIVICYFHWGSEYRNSPNAADQALAKFAAQNGADIIFASHPHILQPIKTIKVEVPYKTPEKTPAAASYGELIRPSKQQTGTWTKTVPVYYSMGNFISNQRYEELANRYGETTARRTEQGMIANVRILYNKETGKITYKEINCIPTWVDRYSSGGKYQYYIVPLVGNFSKNATLTYTGHVSRAQNALTYIKQLLGEEFIYSGQ